MEEKYNEVSISAQELADNILIQLYTGYEKDYFNFIHINNDGCLYLDEDESIEPHQRIILSYDLIDKINKEIKKKSMAQIQLNWKASEIINKMSLEYDLHENIPNHIKEMIYSGELIDLPIETLVKLSGGHV